MMLLILCAVVFGTIGVGFCIQRVGEATEEVAAAYEVRYASYLLADELRQSSDDLTRLARTYVVSGDGKWKDQYQEVLDIRAGKRERPAQYHKIYWDLRAADIRPSRGTEPALALVDLMKSAGFTEEEFAKLSEAERNSNDLVRTETLAMNMVGSQEGAKSPVPEAVNAQAMMHDASYHQFKAKIMQPVDEFFTAVDRRTQQAITAAQGKKAFWYATLICITAALLTVLVVALWAVYRQLSRSLEEAVRVSDAIAAGSLDVAVIASGPQEVASLLNKMSIMRDRLANVVSSVRQNAQAVASTCEQIAQGNGDLSARTQEQASSLEQTAASMEELSATVHRNADSATEADRLSHGASRIATRGGEAVGKVVDTMKEISESSGRISDIIGVIDDIAFQTNLLALNAAVEAARAGEQGRSFAVVAVEVRQLAQRSAEAARQIRELILNSVDRVKQGRAFVDQAGATMSELVEAIKQVTNVMGHIKTAGIEQSTGVSQISQAVAQMDGVTQQNAALVEESAAAAEMLAQQAQQLVAAVAAFKLESTSGHVTGERVDSHRVADAARTRTARAASGFEIAA